VHHGPSADEETDVTAADPRPPGALTRRRFLVLAGAAGTMVLLPVRLPRMARAQSIIGPGDLEPFVDPLPIPPVWSTGELASRGLRMSASTHRFHRQMPGPTRTWGYGGASYLGPTIEAKRGRPVTFIAYNDLTDGHILEVDETLHGPDHAHDQQHPRVSVHQHGGYVEPGSDGYPEDTFVPGESHRYHYDNDQQAGTLWYHDHALGITRLNVYAGLAGFYLLRDPHEGRLGLPPRPFEIPLAIQDRTFDADGALSYPADWEPEFFGNLPVVNGKVRPYLDVKRGWYRLRLLNGSGSRFYNLQVHDAGGAVLPILQQIGTDTGLLERRTSVGTEESPLVLAPGERADVLVDFGGVGPGTSLYLADVGPGDRELFVSPADEAEVPHFSGGPADCLMEFRLARGRGFSRTPAAVLRSAPIVPPGPVVRDRNLTLVEIMDPETEEPVMALLNNRPWDTSDIETPTVDTVERWNLINLTEDSHPIHLHLVQFLLENRQPIDAEGYLEEVYGTAMLTPEEVGEGDRPYPSPDDHTTGPARPPWPSERGWKDTIQAHPGEVTRIIVPFGPGAGADVPFGERVTHVGEYVWHCHILEHEDNEMMLPYRVVGSTDGAPSHPGKGRSGPRGGRG
jgi:spore coat protein A, manganese oxidase